MRQGLLTGHAEAVLARLLDLCPDLVDIGNRPLGHLAKLGRRESRFHLVVGPIGEDGQT